jgi:hypothetical protein
MYGTLHQNNHHIFPYYFVVILNAYYILLILIIEEVYSRWRKEISTNAGSWLVRG